MEILDLENAESVKLHDGSLEIQRLVVNGEAVSTAALLVEQGRDLPTAVRHMLEVGGVVVRYGAQHAAVDSVASEIDRLVATIAETAATELPEVLGAHSRDLRSLLETHFDPAQTSSVQNQLLAALATALRTHQGELTQRLLDEAGPIGILRADLAGRLTAIVHANDRLTEQVTSLQQQVAVEQATAVERARGTGKGLDYEAAVALAVEAIHAPLQDVVHQIGAEAGPGGRKAGDIVIEINPQHTQGRLARVVVEAKCRRLSMRAALLELDNAMQNREAEAGVIVFASAEHAPLGGRHVRVFPGNRVMAVLDQDVGDTLVLEAACTIARAAACRAAFESDAEFDAEALDEHLRRLLSILDDARAIARGVTTARRGVDQIDAAYATLRLAAAEVIADVQESLAHSSRAI